MSDIYELIVLLLKETAEKAANVPSSRGAYEEAVPEKLKTSRKD